jgi:DNA-binding CsgD family transcriptional regulator
MLEASRADASRDQQVVVDEMLGPLYVSLNRLEDVVVLLDQHADDERHGTSRLALKAVVSAMLGDVDASRDIRSRLRSSEDIDELLLVYTLQRCSLAAFYSRDFLEAVDWATRAANVASAIGAHRSAATAYSVLYAVHHTELSDNVAALRFAKAQEVEARACGNASLEAAALVAQYEIAAENADDIEHAALAKRVEKLQLPQQYLERFTRLIAALLSHGWKADFAALKANVVVIQGSRTLMPAEEALCYALRALAEAVRDEAEDGRRNARRALSLTDAYGQRRANVIEQRLLLQARAVAAAACILLGDETRGKRVFETKVMQSPLAVGIHACVNGGSWEDCHPPSRGIARVIVQARASIRSAATSSFLTPTERLILDMLDEGLSAPSIARRSNRSVHTVRVHIRNINAKFQVSSRSLAVAEARRRGYL